MFETWGEPGSESVCSGSSDAANEVYAVIHSGYYTTHNATQLLELVWLWRKKRQKKLTKLINNHSSLADDDDDDDTFIKASKL